MKALLVIFALGLFACSKPPPKPCADYSYKISRLPFNPKVATCDRWTDMEMKIEKMGFLGGQMVHCKCTARSIDIQRR